MRGPIAPPQVPLAASRAEVFADLVQDSVERLERRWPQLADMDFLVLEVPRLEGRGTDVWATQWLRAAGSAEGAERTTALRYAGGVLLCLVGWLGLVLLPQPARPWVFLVMAVAELCVPVYAEKDHETSWHAHHIAERYGLFTIIVLGETVAAATVAVKSAVEEHDALGELLPIAAGGLLIVFSAWWIYFVVPVHSHLRSNTQAFLWGYGHYLIFASAAAIGAGLEVSVEQTVGRTQISTLSASAAVTLPTALYLLTVWALHSRHFKSGI
ncbi:low temperature requirement protein A, partial [Streptomyces sp. NPDC005071]